MCCVKWYFECLCEFFVVYQFDEQGVDQIGISGGCYCVNVGEGQFCFGQCVVEDVVDVFYMFVVCQFGYYVVVLCVNGL